MIGYRVFHICVNPKNEPRLYSLVSDFVWDQPVEFTGTLDIYEGELFQETPFYLYKGELRDWQHGYAILPELGFWAFYNQPDIMFWDLHAWAKVNGFGKIAKHTRGFRSTHMQILELTINCVPGYLDKEYVLKQFALRYQCDIKDET